MPTPVADTVPPPPHAEPARPAAAGRRLPASWAHWLAGVLLLAGMAASFWAWHAGTRVLQREADQQFDRFSELVFANVSQRVQHHIDLMTAFQALFRASDAVSAAEFRAYHQDMRVDLNYRGVLAMRVFTGLPGTGGAPAEPGSGSPMPPPLRLAFQEPASPSTRLPDPDEEMAASLPDIARARDSGEPRASAPRVGGAGERPVVVLHVPLYRGNAPADSVTERRRAYLGGLMAMLRTDDLLGDALPTDQAGTMPSVRIEDHGRADIVAQPGSSVDARPLLVAQPLAGATLPPPAEVDPSDRREHALDMAGRHWALVVERPPVNHALAPLPLLLLGGGTLISLALASLVAGLARRQQQAQALAEAYQHQSRVDAARLRAVFDATVEGIVTADADGRVLSLNQAAQRMFGQPAEALVGGHVRRLMAPDHAQRHAEVARRGQDADEALRQLMQIGRAHEVQARRADGSGFPVELTVTESWVDGRVQFVGVLRDLTEAHAARQRAEAAARALHEANTLREAVFQHAAFGLIVTDPQGGIRALNPAAETLLGCPAPEAVGRNLLDEFHEGEDRQILSQVVSMLRRGLAPAPGETSPERQIQCLRADGRRVPVSTTVTPLRDDAGRVSGMLMISYDNTERLRLAQQLAHLAFHDGLTGLPNRRALQQRLQQAIRHARRHAQPLALLFFDLDGFKPINDTHGHAVGDEVLCETARRLQHQLRGTDCVARLGGDEFVVLLTPLARLDDAPVVADKLLTALSEPMQIGGLRLAVSASVGVASYPEAGEDADTLLKRADAAMYQAKQAGRHTLKRLGLDAG